MSTKRKVEENLLSVDVSADPKYPSKIWLQFKLAKNEGIAQCNNCGNQVNAKNVYGNMLCQAAMIRHLNICLNQNSAHPNKKRP